MWRKVCKVGSNSIERISFWTKYGESCIWKSNLLDTRFGLRSIVSTYFLVWLHKDNNLFFYLVSLYIKICNYVLLLFSAFCLIDEQKTCIVVTVYNLAKGRGVTVGDSVGIPEPFVIHQKFTYMNNVSNICMLHILVTYIYELDLFFLLPGKE